MAEWESALGFLKQASVQKSAAKVQHYFDICKYFKNI